MPFREVIIFNVPIVYIYPLLILIIFSTVLFIVLKNLKKATVRREERFIKKENDKAFSKPTKTMRRSNAKKRKSGLESIEKQFTITRKILIPFILLLALIVAVVPFLNQVPAAIFSLFIAGFSLILGIAVKPLLENVFAGLVISYSKSLNIGDTVVVDDKYGTVEDITMSYTTIKTWDWKRYILPNSKMIQQEFLNLTLVEKYQWAYVEFYVAYDTDIEKVKEIALKCASENKHTVVDNVPYFWVMDMKEESYVCWIASWTEDPATAWSFKNDIRTDMIIEFQKAGIKSYSIKYFMNENPPV